MLVKLLFEREGATEIEDSYDEDHKERKRYRKLHQLGGLIVGP